MANDFLLKFLPVRSPGLGDRRALMRAMGQQLKLYRSGLSLLAGASSSSAPAKPVDIALHYRVWGMQYNRQATEALRSYAAIADLFERGGVDGRLLIVGEAGMGKTHTLLALGELLLQRAAQSGGPIPVLVDLSAWRGETIRQWLIDYLWLEYRIARPLAESWIDNAELCFLWDGFDHLPRANQRSCASALETQLRSNTSQTAVLCCRRKAIEETGINFSQFNSGVLIVPMAAQQVKDYSLALKRPDLWQRIKSDRVLQQLARFPLCLNMLALMKTRQPIKNRKDLIQQFITEKVTATQAGEAKATSSQNLTYLGWLARQLEERPRLFRLEALQRSWLPDSQKFLYRLLLGLCIALMVGVIAGNLVLGLALGLVVSQVDVEAFPRYQLSFATSSWSGFAALALAGTVPAVIAGTVLGGLGATLLSQFDLGLTAFAWGSGLGIVLGWLLGLGVTLWGGLQHSIQIRQTPNQDLHLGFRNVTLLFGWLGLLLISFWMVGAVFSGQPPTTLLSPSRLRLLAAIVTLVIVWLSGGIQQTLVRVLLAINPQDRWPLKCLPWLQNLTRAHLLRAVGGGYSFSHELIRQSLTQPSAMDSNRSTPQVKARQQPASSR
jgi:hypothetical protein